MTFRNVIDVGTARCVEGYRLITSAVVELCVPHLAFRSGPEHHRRRFSQPTPGDLVVSAAVVDEPEGIGDAYESATWLQKFSSPVYMS